MQGAGDEKGGEKGGETGYFTSREPSLRVKFFTADHLAVDLRFLHRRGLLLAGSEGVLSTLEGCQGIAFVVFDAVSSLRLTLLERETPKAAWQLSGPPVLADIVLTACHYGGVRPWFACPNCSRRARLLYAPDFFCQACSGLVHRSTTLQRPYHRDERFLRTLAMQYGGSEALAGLAFLLDAKRTS